MLLLTLTLLYGTFLLLGWVASRRARGATSEELLLAGRAMPLWLATLTMTATWVDGGYLLGTAEGVYRTSLSSGAQGGLFFGLSLVLGGLFFARPMRARSYTTLIDPFEARFGKHWALVLFIPAIMAEIFWSAELLVASGSTFRVLLGYPLTAGVIVSAAVVTLYTLSGGMWSVAWTDAVQLGLVVLGLLCSLPSIFEAVGGVEPALANYLTVRAERGGLLPPLVPDGRFWSLPALAGWWDVSIMLMLGGIPWNCYFQRVLSCRSARAASWHSVLAGGLTILLTAPPLLIGIAAFHYQWPPDIRKELELSPSLTLPMTMRYLVPSFVTLLGFGAIIGAVTSSFSSSILSAASMVSWNGVHRLVQSGLSVKSIRRLIRLSILAFGILAAILALEVRSVQALWFFTSDLVFVLLFPQLLWALYDPRANRIGSICAFIVSFGLRLGGGEPLFGITPTIRYPEILSALTPLNGLIGSSDQWYDPVTGGSLFPCRLLAALMGVITLPIVSRLTGRIDPPRPCQVPAEID
ncbi:MAG: sodium:solute symporter [Acidobacteria bacterium]|nr:sodium:solute symporter [Acidobacteriota bacterium]